MSNSPKFGLLSLHDRLLSLHDIRVKLIGPIDNEFLIKLPDKKICITNVNELDEDMLKFLRIID